MLAPRLLFALAMSLFISATARAEDCCERPSWMFKQSTFTNDPQTGARVAKYARHAYVEELPDPRLVTSGYRTNRTTLRGTAGSYETNYEVASWGNGRGGLDAEWERFHDAWKESYLTGGYYDSRPAYGRGYGYGPRHGYGPYRGGGGYGPGYGYRDRP